MAKFKGKHLNKHERHEIKQAKRNRLLAGIIIFIFAFSMFAVFLYRDDVSGSVIVNGYSFAQRIDGDYYVWQIISGPNDEYIGTTFYYVPDSNYKTTFDSDAVLALLDAPFLYLSVNPEFNTTEEAQALAIQDLARLEIYELLPNKNVVNSVETEFENSLLFGCANATKSATVISFINSNENQGIHINEQNPNCINVIAPPNSVMRYVDMIKFAVIEND